MKRGNSSFNKYQIFLIVVLALVQFTNMLDFMIISPLGAHLSKVLYITSSQFGLVVSAYAFSAAISGLVSALFADRFGRKKLLIFFYSGFIIGTFLCGLADSYNSLLITRIITGAFGGVIASIIFTIITDGFEFEIRGRAIAYIQISFSASQAIGIPLGLFLTEKFSWHMPFLSIACFGLVLLLIVIIWVLPMKKESLTNGDNFHRLLEILSQKKYIEAYASSGLLVIGGFLLMPYASIFLVNNVGLQEKQLPFIYMIAGICTILTGPLIGAFADRLGKYKIFIVGSIFAIVMIMVYTNLPPSALFVVVLIFSILYISVSSRMISGMALITAIPKQQERGSFMSVNSSVQQLAGAVAAVAGGLITYQSPNGSLNNYDILGIITILLVILSIYLLFRINRNISSSGTYNRTKDNINNDTIKLSLRRPDSPEV